MFCVNLLIRVPHHEFPKCHLFTIFKFTKTMNFRFSWAVGHEHYYYNKLAVEYLIACLINVYNTIFTLWNKCNMYWYLSFRLLNSDPVWKNIFWVVKFLFRKTSPVLCYVLYYHFIIQSNHYKGKIKLISLQIMRFYKLFLCKINYIFKQDIVHFSV